MIDIENLKPFPKFCYTIGMIPSSYKESLTYEEQLIWFCSFLQDTVIPTINNNGQAVQELQNLYIELKNYVDNYFENLDVQEEINNKLDEMVEDGTFAELLADYLVLNTITVKIPTDFETIEEAIEFYSYKDIKMNKEIIILIEEDHELTKGLKLINGDYSHFRITSENNYIVKLDNNFIGYNGTDEQHPNTDGTDNSLFVGINCVFPIIDCLFDMENNFGDGMELYLSTGYINNSAGVINAGRYGIYAKDSSKVFAEGTNWSGSNSAGIRLQHTTTGTFNHVTLDECCKIDDTLGSAYISKQCLCQLRESTISNNTTSYGLLARRSRVDIEATEINNCYGGIKAESGSFISATNCILDGIYHEDAVYCEASIIVGGKSINCSHKDFTVYDGGIILHAQETTSNADVVTLSDCRNITSFNVMNEHGMINTRPSNPAYKIENTTNGKLVTFPNHAIIYFSFNKDIQDLTSGNTATINISSDVTIPNGYTIQSFNIDMTGRANTGGGGNTIILNKVNFASFGNVLINNTGYTSGTETTIKSLNVRGYIVLIPSV